MGKDRPLLLWRLFNRESALIPNRSTALITPDRDGKVAKVDKEDRARR